MEVRFTKEEMWDITDCAAYIGQYEDDIVRKRDETMLPFCADMAMKRLFLYDLCPKACWGCKRSEIVDEIREHIEAGRTTEMTKKAFQKMLKKKKS